MAGTNLSNKCLKGLSNSQLYEVINSKAYSEQTRNRAQKEISRRNA